MGALLWNIGAFIVALGLLVAVHEFGHFWVARRCGVKVERFSIGFGKAIWRRVGKDGTEYVLALIPLLGWGNWFLIPFAAVGAIIAAVGILFTRTEHRGRAKAGLVLNGIVVVVGIVRLGLGGGII